jgi:hypothetical protein
VAGYNEDDCQATLALRDWLGRRRDVGNPKTVFGRPVTVEIGCATSDSRRQRAAVLKA